MRYLHLGLPWDTLNGHRDRFRTIHGELRKIYDSMQYIQFLRSLVQIPRLSEDISYFFETLSKMSDRSMSIEEQEVTEFPIQTFQEEDLVSVTTDETVNDSMSYIQQEYSDLSSKYQMVLQMLESEQQQRTLDKDAFLEKEKHMKCELEALRKSYSELSVSSVAEPSTTTGQEEKLEKLKTAYQKLRSDHIALLRQKGDIEKKLVDKSTSQDLQSSKLDATEGALKTFFLSHDIPLQEIENVPLKNKLEMIDEKMSNLQLSLVAKEALIRKLEQMRNETIITHDEKTEQLKILEEKYQKLKIFWTDHIQDRYSTTSSFLEKERNLVGGIPKKEDFFSGFNLVDNHALDQLVTETEKSLRSQDCIVSKTMGTLLQFLPYMNTVEEIDLNLVYNAASDLISKTFTATNNDGGGKIPEDSIVAFEHAINKQYELIQKSASLSSEDDVEDEIGKLFVKIDDAASTMEKLMLAARADESKKSIDVDIKILDECNHLLEVVQRLIKEARDLQTEITAESGILNAKEFYRKNQKWSQGLISAAKDIGGGAKCLVDAADKVVSGDGKFEEIIAASQEIAGSSAQMVFASKVKAKKGSLKLEVLSGTSKLVPEKVARVIATCKYLANTENTESQVDLMALSVHQTKRLEMEVQVKVLELENMLEKEREKLFKIRRDTYNSNNQESNSNDRNFKFYIMCAMKLTL